jgi:hypothetical protein
MNSVRFIFTAATFLFFSCVCKAEDWITTDGKTYKSVKIISHDDKVVTISAADGNSTFPISNLPPNIQKKVLADNTTSTLWTTVDGKIYRNIKIIKNDETSVTILNDEGGAVIQLANLPGDIQKQFNYDPVRIQREEQQKEADQKAELAAEYKSEKKQVEANIKSLTKTLKEVDTDKTTFVGQKFIVEGTISLDTYYNFGYSEAQDTHYSLKIEQGDETAYAYMLKDNPSADRLRKQLLAADGGLQGRFLVEIDPDRFEKESSSLMLLFLDYYPPEEQATTPPSQ